MSDAVTLPAARSHRGGVTPEAPALRPSCPAPGEASARALGVELCLWATGALGATVEDWDKQRIPLLALWHKGALTQPQPLAQMSHRENFS